MSSELLVAFSISVVVFIYYVCVLGPIVTLSSVTTPYFVSMFYHLFPCIVTSLGLDIYVHIQYAYVLNIYNTTDLFS